MLKIVYINNPFDYSDRVIKEIPYNSIANLHSIINNDFVKKHQGDNADIKIAVNSLLIEDTKKYYPQDNDIITICPVIEGGGGGGGAKNVLGAIAMVAVMVVTMGVGSVVSGGAFLGAGATAMTSWTFAGYMAAIAVMYVGGTLVGRMMGTPSVDNSFGDYDTSQTYSWTGAQTTSQQGVSIPLTFGTVKNTNNNCISAHITSSGDKQYLNLLIAGGEGEIDSISDIRIEDNPISYYNDVQYETRLGTNTQSAISIPSFADSYQDESLSYNLETNVTHLHKIPSNTTEGIEITIECPNGLYYANDDGGLSNCSIHIVAKYSPTGKNQWKTFADSTITNATSSVVRKVYSVRNLTPQQYDVIVYCDRRDGGNSSRYGNKAYWTQCSSIIQDKFTYPNTVLVALKALATSQLSSSSPAISWLQTRKYVWVYNPNTEKYEQKRATNPAWACYDILHMCRRMKNPNTDEYEYIVNGCPHTLIQYEDFKKWADECDRREVEINYYFDLNTKLENAFKDIEQAGRGSIVRRGTKYGCVFDSVKQAVQMFTMANIDMSSFSEEFLSTDSRATAVEITFNNKAKNYERDTMIIYSDEYDSTDTLQNPTSINLNAFTDEKQVYKEGVYYLNNNKYLTRTVTFKADVDAISCQVGDLILLQHDVPQWGYGGNIKKATTEYIQIDNKVELEENKQYEITYRLQNDELVKRQIKANAGLTDKLYFTSPIPSNLKPKKNDIYSFGIINKSTKPFTVVSMTRNSDTQFTLECLEYIEDVYAEKEYIGTTNYSTLSSEITALSLTTHSYLNNDVILNDINISWKCNRTNIPMFNIYYSTDNIKWTLIETTGNLYSTLNSVKSGVTYYIKVEASNMKSVYKTSSIMVIPNTEDVSIPNVENVNLTTKYREYTDGSTGFDIDVNFTLPENVINGLVYYKTNALSVDEFAQFEEGVSAEDLGFFTNWKFLGSSPNQVSISNCKSGDTYKFKVLSQNKAGLTSSSENAIVKTITVEKRHTTPAKPYNLRYNFNNSFYFAWDDVDDSDFSYYELRTNKAKGMEKGLLGKTKQPFFTADVQLDRKGKAYVYAVNHVGNYSDCAEVSWDIAKPIPPEFGYSELVRGAMFIIDNKPDNAIKIKYQITGTVTNVNETIYTENDTYNYQNEADIYTVRASYFDIFGEGDYSETDVTIKSTFTGDWITEGTIERDKLDDLVEETLKKADDSVQAIQDAITTANTELNDVKNELEQSVEDNVNTLNTTITNSITKAENELATAKSELENTIVTNVETINNTIDSTKAEIKTTTDSITNTVGTYISDNDKEIAQIKQTATTLSQTVEDYKDGLTQSISQVEQKADGIKTTVENDIEKKITEINTTIEGVKTTIKDDIEGQITQLNTTIEGVKTTVENDVEGKLTTINTTIEGVSATVASNKSDTDTAISNVSQKADGIITTLGKAPNANGQYTALTTLYNTAEGIKTSVSNVSGDLSTLSQTVSGISSTVSSNKSDTDKEISNIKQTASSLSSTVSSNKSATDTAISNVSQKADGIITTLGKAPNANGQYTALTTLYATAEGIKTSVSNVSGDLSTLSQTVSGISSTVSSHGTSISSLSQTASSLSSTVSSHTSSLSSLSSTVSSHTSSISQNAEAIKLKVSTSDLNSKSNIEKIVAGINLDSNGVTIQGKHLHITSATTIDSDVKINASLSANSVTSEMIQAGAITSSKLSVNSLSAISGTIGTLRTKTSGARVEISDNLIVVYDGNNVARVKLGVF